MTSTVLGAVGSITACRHCCTIAASGLSMISFCAVSFVTVSIGYSSGVA